MNLMTVVIPCYNHGQYLAEAVYSCFKQTVPCDIVIVDDGSTDGSDRIACNIRRAHPQIKLILQSNQWVGVARNSGVVAATTPFVMCLDADDTLEPEAIEMILPAFKLADVVGFGHREFGEGDKVFIPYPYPSHERFKVANQMCCSAAFKKDMWRKIGGFDPNPYNKYTDWEFWIRATKEGYTVYNIHAFLLNYRKHGRSMINDAWENHEAMKKYVLEKNGIEYKGP